MDDLRDNNGIEESLRDKKPGSMPAIGNSIRNNNGIENSLRKKPEQKSVYAEVEELKGRVQAQQTAAVDMAATVEQAAGASVGRLDFSNDGEANHAWNRPPKGKWRKIYTDIAYDKDTGKLTLTKREALVQSRAFEPDKPEEIVIETGGGGGGSIPDGTEFWGEVYAKEIAEYRQLKRFGLRQKKLIWRNGQMNGNGEKLIMTFTGTGTASNPGFANYVIGEPKLESRSGTVYEVAHWYIAEATESGAPTLTDTGIEAWSREMKTHADDHTNGVL